MFFYRVKTSDDADELKEKVDELKEKQGSGDCKQLQDVIFTSIGVNFSTAI